jgi:SAM-dependent methyltransferase
VEYGVADTFVRTLLQIGDSPEETLEKEPEMVFYKPTPVRIVLELIEKADITGDDVFYDLGSGLGQVAILVHLLSGAGVMGIEYEPSYCAYAHQRAQRLDLSGVAFVNVDARAADLSDGTIFYLYTPFRGQILQDVLDKLKAESLKRSIRVCTCGPCTPSVAEQDWLECTFEAHADEVEYHAAIFESI